MKITLTGSLGHITKPLTQELTRRQHSVTVITRDAAKQKEIQQLGASASIGSLEDVQFLTDAFSGADAVYCMVPPNNYFDHSLHLRDYYGRLGGNYAQAIRRSGVKRVINLSTIGAHLSSGSGILLGAHDVQRILDDLPSDIAITHMRPTSFFYNLYGYVQMIKKQGVIAANYGSDRIIPWVSPLDIASAVAEEITTLSNGRKVRYVASEEASGDETARILGIAIGNPNLKWILVSEEKARTHLESIGMNKQIVAGMVEMYGALHSGLLAEDYYRNRPAEMGKVKLRDFAREFAVEYNQM